MTEILALAVIACACFWLSSAARALLRVQAELERADRERLQQIARPTPPPAPAPLVETDRIDPSHPENIDVSVGSDGMIHWHEH